MYVALLGVVLILSGIFMNKASVKFGTEKKLEFLENNLLKKTINIAI